LNIPDNPPTVLCRSNRPPPPNVLAALPIFPNWSVTSLPIFSVSGKGISCCW